MNSNLRQLLIQLKYQKIGNIPDSILAIFRDMCAVLGYLEVRDRFSLELRNYTKFFLERQEISMINSNSRKVAQMNLNLIDFGNLLLAYQIKNSSNNNESSVRLFRVTVK